MLTKILHDKVLFVYTLIFALGIGFYLQGNYLPCDYGVLNGVEVVWENYGLYGTLSVIVWGGCLIINLLWYFLNKETLKRGITIISICLVLIETLTLGVLYIQIRGQTSNGTLVFTSKEEFEFSDEENIIVLCLDAFDSSVFSEIINEDTEYQSWFPGFTYYPDVVGGYPTTKGSIPFVISGIRYENQETFSEYLENAYRESLIFEELKERGYSIDIYTSSAFASPYLKNIVNNLDEAEYVSNSNIELGKAIYKFVFYKYVPHQFKYVFWMYTGEFDKYKSIRDEEGQAFSSDTIRYYEELGKGINVTEERNKFKFIHINGVHVPYTFDENLKLKDGVTEKEQAKGNLRLVKRFVDKLKVEGIYNQATIIVLADHGQRATFCQNPLFMIKGRGDHEGFKINEKALSYDMLEKIIVELLNGVQGDEIGDIVKRIFTEPRRFLYYNWDNSWDKQYLPEMVEYSVLGKAWETEKISKTGVVYKAGEVINSPIYEYNGADVIPFDNQDKCRSFLKSGFSLTEMNPDGKPRMWSDGKYSIFHVYIPDTLNYDLRLNIIADPLVESKIRIYANDILVDERDSSDLNNILIPLKSINKNDVLEIKLDYGDVKSPYELRWSNDRRRLGLYFTSVEFLEP